LYSLKISTLTKCEDYSQYKLLFPFPVFLLVSLREPLWFECVLTEATVKDTLFASALEALKMNGPFPITSKLEDWCLEDDLLFF